MNDAKVVIATTTFYKERSLRFELACETIRKAREAGYEIVVVEGSKDDPSIAETFSKLGAHVYPETLPGMGPSRRLAFFYAYHLIRMSLNLKLMEVIIWMEPEKVNFVRHILLMLEKLRETDCDIAIMKRSEASWQTYPDFQRKSEQLTNTAYEEHTGRIGYDPMSGPVAFVISKMKIQPELLLFFNPKMYDLPDTYIQHYLPLFVSEDRVISVEVDFLYPLEQKREEERTENETIRKKRQWQMETLIEAYKKLGEIAPFSKHCEVGFPTLYPSF